MDRVIPHDGIDAVVARPGADVVVIARASGQTGIVVVDFVAAVGGCFGIAAVDQVARRRPVDIAVVERGEKAISGQARKFTVLHAVQRQRSDGLGLISGFILTRGRVGSKIEIARGVLRDDGCDGRGRAVGIGHGGVVTRAAVKGVGRRGAIDRGGELIVRLFVVHIKHASLSTLVKGGDRSDPGKQRGAGRAKGLPGEGFGVFGSRVALGRVQRGAGIAKIDPVECRGHLSSPALSGQTPRPPTRANRGTQPQKRASDPACIAVHDTDWARLALQP